MEFTIYVCKNCSWEGMEHEVDYEPTEGCVGDDKIEVCPKCGSMNLIPERREQE